MEPSRTLAVAAWAFTQSIYALVTVVAFVICLDYFNVIVNAVVYSGFSIL